MTKTIDALTLAEKALEGWKEYDTWTDQQMWNDDDEEALVAIREALAEPVKQEPIGYIDDMAPGLIHWTTGDWPNEGTKLYAAPVSVEAAVLAEREACAEVCDRFAENESGFVAEDCAATIRARGNK